MGFNFFAEKNASPLVTSSHLVSATGWARLTFSDFIMTQPYSIFNSVWRIVVMVKDYLNVTDGGLVSITTMRLAGLLNISHGEMVTLVERSCLSSRHAIPIEWIDENREYENEFSRAYRLSHTGFMRVTARLAGEGVRDVRRSVDQAFRSSVIQGKRGSILERIVQFIWDVRR